MKILIVSGHDDKYQCVANFTVPNKKEYCHRHKYDFRCLALDAPEINLTHKKHGVSLDDQNYYKLSYINQDIIFNNYDWIMWIDCDAYIMNMTISLDSFIDNDYDFIIGEDWNGINAGVYLLKMCRRTHVFLNACLSYVPTEYDKRNTPDWWWPTEQCAYDRHKHMLNTKIVHHHFFNGYLTDMAWHNDWRHCNLGSYNFKPRKFQIGDFILHLVGTHMNKKLDILSTLEHSIIR